LGNGHINKAPMMHWALANTGACSWRWMSNPDNLTEEEKTVVALNLTQNVTAGYTISFLSVMERTKGATALTAKLGMSQDDVDAVWAKHGDEINLMNNVMHLKIQTLPYFNDPSQSDNTRFYNGLATEKQPKILRSFWN
jgi:LuxR family transcriptional regulator